MNAEMEGENLISKYTFQCNVCGKELSRKQRLITHQLSKHGIQPNYNVQKYKLYEEDPSIPVPRSTFHRHKQIQQSSSHDNRPNDTNLTQLSAGSGSTHNSEDNSPSFHTNVQGYEPEYDQYSYLPGPRKSTNQDQYSEVLNKGECTFDLHNCLQQTVQSNKPVDHACTVHDEEGSFDTKNIITDSESDISISSSSDSEEEKSGKDDISDLSSTSEDDGSSFEVRQASSNKDTYSKSEEKSMTLLAYVLKYHLGGQASKNLLKLAKQLDPEVEIKDVNQLKQVVGLCDPDIVHFCEKCFTIFPNDENVVHCTQSGCPGLRYKGSVHQQHLKRKKSFFTILPIYQQVKDILQTDGIWSSLCKYRELCSASPNITDLINAEIYSDLLKPGNFMESKCNISLLFNTDGVPLYQSSGVSLWPLYLVINELPPVLRFSRKNLILWGIWQSQGKPIFHTFLQPFIQHMRELKDSGIQININKQELVVKAILVGGTMDLQAKAYLASMTQHNGQFGCITCEDPGEMVQQGRGHARVYPYRQQSDIYKERTSAEVLQCGLAAMNSNKTEIGIKGVSCLHGLEWFDVVWGLLPDYMHGVLLGVTKMMLKLWFSSYHSRKPYFIGDYVKVVDKHLKRMQPTDEISRLPRKLEHHMHHLKASELQIWLLFYSIPCVIDVMQPEYVEHLCCLVQGIYILLSDHISPERLDHAGHVLNLFYSRFAGLYGKNNCTLNVHNTGRHLVQYVKKLGPLWAWSCFPFEDMNGTILEYVHGTGDVCIQILQTVQAKKSLAVNAVKMQDSGLKELVVEATNTQRHVSIKCEASNCKIAGGMQCVKLDEDMEKKVRQVLDIHAHESLGKIFKILRIVMNEKVYFSCAYTRMSKRLAYLVLLKIAENPVLASVQYFLYHENSNTCVGIVKPLKIKNNCALIHPGVNHLIAIEPLTQEAENQAIPVQNIQEKILYIGGNSNRLCVARLPNLYGQCS